MKARDTKMKAKLEKTKINKNIKAVSIVPENERYFLFSERLTDGK